MKNYTAMSKYNDIIENIEKSIDAIPFKFANTKLILSKPLFCNT